MGNAPSQPKDQSYVVPDSAREGWGPIHRSMAVRDGPLLQHVYEDVTTLYENFQRGVRLHADRPCLGYRPVSVVDGEEVAGGYSWSTYKAVNKRVFDFGCGLRNCGLEKGGHMGVYGVNTPEWTIAEQACYTQGFVPISLYDTLGPEAVAYIVQQAEISTIVASSDKITKVLEVAEQCPTLKLIIQMENEGDKEIQALAEEKGIKLKSFGEVEKNGHFFSHEPQPPTPDDLATIMYTSGTTGAPKGVMLSHRNVVAMVSAGIKMGIQVTEADVHISYLPLAHIFERALQTIMLCSGGAIGFFRGSVLQLFEDIAELKPTVFASVPRLFNKLHDKALLKVTQTGGIKKMLFDRAYHSKKQLVDQNQKPESAFWDKVVFEGFRAKLGGRVRLIVTGSAPINKDVYQFLQVCFSVPVLQGYGLTETAAAATLTLPDDFTPGHVGPPLPSVEVCLQDVPEMKYTSDGEVHQGEVCIRGHNVFQGYYKMPEKTDEDLDKDGWFHTGDIGQWNPNGTLSIIDRKKNIFKLSQGEYVAAEYVEGVLAKHPLVEQVFVYGDSLQDCLVGVVVPDFEALLPWAQEQGMEDPDEDHSTLCANPDLVKHYLKELESAGRASGLKGFEVVRALHLEPTPFSVEANLLTPTFKLRRPNLKEHYQATIEGLYESLRR